MPVYTPLLVECIQTRRQSAIYGWRLETILYKFVYFVSIFNTFVMLFDAKLKLCYIEFFLEMK